MLSCSFKKHAKTQASFCDILVHLHKSYIFNSYLKYILCILCVRTYKMIQLLGNLKYMYLIYKPTFCMEHKITHYALRVHVGRMLQTSRSWLDEFS